MLTALLFIYKILLKTLDLLLHIIAYVMVFLGAYIPFFYLIYGFIISAIFHFSLFDSASLYSKLYITGLILTLVATLIIAVRNIILKPTYKVLSLFDGNEQNTQQKNKKLNKHSKYDLENDCKRIDKRNYRQNYENNDNRKRNDHTENNSVSYRNGNDEQPLIYRSQKYPEITVYEYRNYFELYKYVSGRLSKIKTVRKNNHGK